MTTASQRVFDSATPEQKLEAMDALQAVLDHIWDSEDPLVALEEIRPLVTMSDGRIPRPIEACAKVIARMRQSRLRRRANGEKRREP